MNTLPRRLLQDVVTVEPYSGESGYGPIHAAAATVLGKISATRQLVRNSDGEEVVSEVTLYVHPADAAPFVPGSRVTIATRVSTVIAVSPQGRPGEDVLVKVACS